AGYGDELRGAGPTQPRLHPRRCEGRGERPSVPVRHLPERVQGHARRGGAGTHVRSRRGGPAMSAQKTPTKTQTVSYGIVGQSIDQVQRSVPENEPPPLPANASLKVIGKPVDRLDAVQKVTGKARFTFDVQLPGMLFARRVVSSVAHA